MKKLLAMVLVLTLVLSCFAACGGGKSGESTDAAKTQTKAANNAAGTNEPAKEAAGEYEGPVNLVVGQVGSDFGGLNPYAKSTGFTFKDYIFERLFIRDGYGGDLLPRMGKSYEKVAERTYHISIFDNIYDNAGNHITADDVVFSYEHARDCGTVTKMYYMESIEKVNDYEVKIVTSSEDVGTYENLLSNVFIVDKDAWVASGDDMATTPIGTGPYAMTDFVNGSHMVLTKRDDYWQTDATQIWEHIAPNVDSLTIQMIADASALTVALETGSVDVVSGLTGSNLDYFMNEDGTPKAGYNVYSTTNSLVPCLFFNMEPGSMFEGNLELRQAILYAINTEDLVTACLDGKGEVCYTLGSKMYGDFQDSWLEEDYYWHDAAKAAELLEKSSFVQTAPIRIMTQSSSPFKEYAQLIGAFVYSLGLEYELLTYDQTLFNEAKYDPTAWDIKIDPCKSPDVFPNIWNYCFNWNNYDCYGTNFIRDEYFQEILALIATPEGHTDENIDACHQYLKENAWAIGLVNPTLYYVSKDTVVMNAIDDVFHPISCTVTADYVPVK